MIKVYEYSGCSTCRNALKFLEKRKVAYTKIPIVEQPPSKAELKRMLAAVGGEIKRLFNTSGALYREMKVSEKLPKLSNEQAIALLAQHGKLIKRPFLLTPNGGAVGFREQEWKELV